MELLHINNVTALKPEELVGFFKSTSYVSSYMKSIDNPDEYLAELADKIKRINGDIAINTDFCIELVMAKKKDN